MAVRKTGPTALTADAYTPADELAYAPPTLATENSPQRHEQPTQDYDSQSEAKGRDWRLRLIRLGAALLVVFEIIYFIFDRYIPPPLTLATTALHAIAVGITVLVLALTTSKWLERNWRPVCFVALLAIYGVTLALRLLTGDTEPLFITVALSLVGAAAMAPWSTRWQAGLSAAALATVSILALVPAPADSRLGYQWVGVLIAAILGHFILLMRQGYRAELTERMGSLRASHQELADALARSAAVMAERELAERRLRESEATLREMFETSLDSIAINRLSDGRFIAVNDEFARTMDYSREELLASTGSQIRAFANRVRMREMLERLRTDGFARNFEIELRTRTGRLIPHLFSGTVVSVAGDLCVIAIMHDISQLKRTECELIAAREAALAGSEAKSEFLSIMSHEIRTPMNAILGMADLLWETPLGVEQRRYLDTMRSNGNSLLSLVNGILDLARVESGRLSLERADFDLVELSEGVMETLGVRAHEKRLELALRIRPEVSTALIGDPLRLRQILINLLGNAIKFTEHGEVTLTVEAAAPAQSNELPVTPVKAQAAGAGESPEAGIRQTRQLLRFVVRDTGVGIAANKLETIFSNFIQADSTISRRYGGSGLGLAIVKRLVELMNGQIGIDSRLGEGTTLSFVIPLEVQPEAAAPGSPAGTFAAHLNGKRVLVADDSPASRDILAELLGLVGAEVVAAADGSAALREVERARAANRPYDVILADCRMPPPDGGALARHVLGTAGQAREALVLMLTADDLNFQLGRLHAGGLEESQRCRYLLKPLRRADLWATIAAACSGTAEGHGYRNGASVAAPDAALVPAGTVRPRTALVKRPLKILLAEDSPDNRLLIEAYLKSTPYQLDYAEDGEAAVRKFMTAQYDAILMDIQMPVMDGYEAIAEIRRLEQSGDRPRTPILVLTASAHDEAARRSFQMGGDAHVTKPVKRSTLLEAIRDAVKPTPQTEAIVNSGAQDAATEVPQEPIVVQLDQDLSDLVPGFIARKREDARAILTAAEHGESEAIARLGHKMKGEGGSYGLNTITSIGQELEQAGKAADLDTARRLARELINYLDRIEIVYRPMED